jgi:hypothetical protein
MEEGFIMPELYLMPDRFGTGRLMLVVGGAVVFPSQQYGLIDGQIHVWSRYLESNGLTSAECQHRPYIEFWPYLDSMSYMNAARRLLGERIFHHLHGLRSDSDDVIQRAFQPSVLVISSYERLSLIRVMSEVLAEPPIKFGRNARW